MIALRYEGDAAAATVAARLYDATGDVAGLEPEGDFDGGWRGQIHFVPELPVGRYRRHLVDVAAALEDLERFLDDVRARAPAPVHYRTRDVAFRFLRSVGRTTPSAFAEHGSVGYNVAGSLLGTASGVKETLVHEYFHLNDEPADENAEPWSARALGPIFDGIVASCGERQPCLAPYAPNDTTVRGGTFYAFQPGGGPHEYAAELAVRYVKEVKARLAAAPPPVVVAAQGARPFKCGPAENARAWAALVGAFFGGFDPIPGCAAR
jgi:hypothetical protein